MVRYPNEPEGKLDLEFHDLGAPFDRPDGEQASAINHEVGVAAMTPDVGPQSMEASP